jgi:CBS domain containing-hemolysin-like protein
MASSDSSNSQTSSPRNPLLALMSRLGMGASEGERTLDSSQTARAVDLVDQAEAFKDLRVGDVLTPRADVVALELSTPLGDVVRRFTDSEHTRIPIYRETLDDPVGVAHLKDVMKLIAPEAGRPQPDWNELALPRIRREVLYVPASMRAADLLLKMQTTRLHMALVIDEFGGTDGLVTLEDLLEAVVGEIEDEHDEHVANPIVERPGGLIEADARAPLEDLETLVGEHLSPPDLEEEIETVAGLVATIAGRVPQRGEVIHHPAGFDFEVLDADPRRLKRLRIRRVEPVTDQA